MDIFALRDVIFTDLKCPLAQLQHRGFAEGLVPDDVRVFGNTAYFYADGQDWSAITPECMAKTSNVNAFRGEEHTLSLEVSKKEWTDNVTEQLKNCARMVYDRALLPLANRDHSTFDSFWAACSKNVENIRLLDYAYTKRGHKKQFINMYNPAGEITGLFDLVPGSMVRASVRWTFNVSTDADQVSFGFRAGFSGGIRVIKMAGAPPNIRKPWLWKHFNFQDFSLPMYESFIVKCPALTVVEHFGPSIKLDLSNKPEFKNAMDIFHEKAGADQWDGTIHLNTSKTVVVGQSVLASVSGVRNKDHIDWHTVKLFPLRRQKTLKILKKNEEKEATMAGTKRDADNTGNFVGAKTKRQCIPGDIRDHMIK